MFLKGNSKRDLSWKRGRPGSKFLIRRCPGRNFSSSERVSVSERPRLRFTSLPSDPEKTLWKTPAYEIENQILQKILSELSSPELESISLRYSQTVLGNDSKTFDLDISDINNLSVGTLRELFKPKLMDEILKSSPRDSAIFEMEEIFRSLGELRRSILEDDHLKLWTWSTVLNLKRDVAEETQMSEDFMDSLDCLNEGDMKQLNRETYKLLEELTAVKNKFERLWFSNMNGLIKHFQELDLESNPRGNLLERYDFEFEEMKRFKRDWSSIKEGDRLPRKVFDMEEVITLLRYDIFPTSSQIYLSHIRTEVQALRWWFENYERSKIEFFDSLRDFKVGYSSMREDILLELVRTYPNLDLGPDDPREIFVSSSKIRDWYGKFIGLHWRINNFKYLVEDRLQEFLNHR